MGREAHGYEPDIGGAWGWSEEYQLPRGGCGVSRDLPNDDGGVCTNARARGRPVSGAPAAEYDGGGGDFEDGRTGDADAYVADVDRHRGRRDSGCEKEGRKESCQEQGSESGEGEEGTAGLQDGAT